LILRESQRIFMPSNRGSSGEKQASSGIHKPRVTGSSPVAAIELTSTYIDLAAACLTTLDNFSRAGGVRQQF
jgi:hypothetical protein